ncbi:MAG: hypothetical protein QM647_07655 [Asticcacaulis sp.]|uniref:hypothetical protein n=1 Tax=Asticcacaulis sp. TaxID=1872648 RepID=UPI0039E28A23
MARSAVYIPPYKEVRPSDGREWVIFESLVAFLSLMLIVSGFVLYIGHAFEAKAALPGGAIEISHQTVAERPLSLVEA